MELWWISVGQNTDGQPHSLWISHCDKELSKLFIVVDRAYTHYGAQHRTADTVLNGLFNVWSIKHLIVSLPNPIEHHKRKCVWIRSKYFYRPFISHFYVVVFIFIGLALQEFWVD